jgi:hypothetical protein
MAAPIAHYEKEEHLGDQVQGCGRRCKSIAWFAGGSSRIFASFRWAIGSRFTGRASGSASSTSSKAVWARW